MSSTFLAFVNFPSFLSIPPRRRRLHIIKLNGRLRSNSQTSPVTNCKFLAIRFFFLTSGQVKALEEEIASSLSNSPDESNASKHICCINSHILYVISAATKHCLVDLRHRRLDVIGLIFFLPTCFVMND
ncbi:hypothetical protein OIU79_016419 [Salix purpurea]|uniref:Uncharacterized protein n=1 Tax=Salix purpurea TaxID=77065 RepID=A0A9Q0SQQ7_SALPP|nr:hypothetical protein OIU79_016419 [Salix purpurea]